jgi:hypothetical protein
MARQARDEVDESALKGVRDAIGRWRRTRERRTRMPAGLWAGAVALARTHGTYRVARALRVDYQGLARRLAEAGHRGSDAKRVDFVELRAADLLGGSTVVEVSAADGARLTIRVSGGSAVDAAALIAAFRGQTA